MFIRAGIFYASHIRRNWSGAMVSQLSGDGQRGRRSVTVLWGSVLSNRKLAALGQQQVWPAGEGLKLPFWWPQRARACEASDHPVMGRLEVD